MNTITDFDFKLLELLQSGLKCEFLDMFMPVVTALGNAGIIWIITAIILLITKKYRRSGVLLTIGLLLGLVVCNIILKPTVARLRPCWIRDVVLLIKNPTDYSFPSGHTLASAISAVILWKADKRFRFPAVVLAVLIAFSRLYLYVHFPSDVICGAVIGILIALAAFKILPWIEKIDFSSVTKRK